MRALTTPRTTWSFDIPSDLAAGDEFIRDLLDQLNQLDWSEQDVFGVHLAAQEAIVNAIKHGNQFDRAKKVGIQCRATPSEVWLRVADDGEGFCVHDVPNPTDVGNREQPSGRGIVMMRQFMTEVEFSQSGTCVTMLKVRGRA